MADQDTSTTFIGRGGRGQPRSKQAVNAAMRAGGGVDTSKKYAAGGNKQTQANMNTSKLDQETEELRHEALQIEVCKLIQQGRQAKGMTQKDLATKINEKQQVVNEYESGRAIPNQQILAKLERVLAIKLRGKDKGKVLK